MIGWQTIRNSHYWAPETHHGIPVERQLAVTIWPASTVSTWADWTH